MLNDEGIMPAAALVAASLVPVFRRISIWSFSKTHSSPGNIVKTIEKFSKKNSDLVEKQGSASLPCPTPLRPWQRMVTTR